MILILKIVMLVLALATTAHSQSLDRTHINYINPLDHGASCNATTVNAAITSISTNKATFFFTKTDRAKTACSWAISTSVTFAANTTVWIPAGVTIVPAGGVTITFNGPVVIDDVDSLQGDGSYTFNYVETEVSASKITSGCTFSVPVSSLTLGQLPCTVSMNVSNKHFLIPQDTATVGPLNGGNGSYFVLFDFSKTRAISGWTRQTNTHYLWIKSTTQPAAISGAVMLAQVKVDGGVIETVNTAAYIQEMINSQAKTVIVPPGTWTIGTQGLLIDSKTDFKLQCETGAIFKTNGTTALVSALGPVTAVLIISCTRCVVDGCTFDGNYTNYNINTVSIRDSNQTTFKNNHIYNGGELAALSAGNNDYNQYLNNHIEGPTSIPGSGMWIGNTPAGTVERFALIQGNHIHDILGGSGISGTQVSSIIANNHLHNNSNSGVAPGCGIMSELDNTIIGNVIHHNGFSGIQIDAASSRCARISIVGNISYGNADCGIFINAANYMTITGNTVKDNADYGICVSDSSGIVINGNTAFNSGEVGQPVQVHGIYLNTGADDTRDISIVGNFVQDNSDTGIRVDTSGGTVMGLVVANNIARRNDNIGIAIIPDALNAIERVSVVGNVMRENVNADMRLGTVGSPDFISLIEVGNNVFTTTTGVIAATGPTRTATHNKNVRGNCTYVSNVATCVVALPFTEPDTAYFVAISCNEENENWVTTKTTTAFTINRPAAIATTAICDWMLMR